MGWSLELQILAERGAGVVDRSGALAVGIPLDAVDDEVKSGRLVAVHSGVYRAAAVPFTSDVRLRAALLAAGPDAVVSHRSAAHRHDLVSDGYDAIDLLVPHHRRLRLTGVTIRRSLDVPDDHVRHLDGLPITTVDRTLADLGAAVRSSTVARAVEQAVIQRKTTIDRLYRLADEHGRRGRTGIGALRAALDDWALGDRPPDSVLEVLFARLVRRFDLPVPVFQHVITDDDGFVARVDAAWPDQRLFAEVDGLHAHGTATALRHDHLRQNRLLRLGWTVQRFDWHLVVRQPSRVAADLSAALAAAPTVAARSRD